VGAFAGNERRHKALWDIPDACVGSWTQQFCETGVCTATALGFGGSNAVDRVDAYRRYAAQCVEMARRMNSPKDRSVLLQMALLWSRLAKYAANQPIPKEPAET